MISPGSVTPWVHIAHKHKGVWRLPDIGVQAVVGFVGNRIERAIVLGFMYDEKHRAPIEEGEKAAESAVFQTKRHRIDIVYKDGKETFTISTAKGKMRFVMDKDAGMSLINELGDIKIKCRNVRVEAEDIALSGEKAIRLESEADIEAETSKDIKIENDIKYDVVDGIFKKFCDNARKAIIETNNNDIPLEAIVWKVTVRGQVREECFNNNHVRIDWNFDDAGAVGFVEEVKKGDIIITTDGSRTRINGIAVVTDEKGYTLDKEERDTTTRNVKWLATNIDENIKSINKEKMLQRRTVARVPNMKVEDIIKLAKEKNPTALSKIDIKENKEPYVFIIDEINRGNISKIFGELITLIETTKRSGEGKEECISTKLPYSNEEFTVPDNVYIIGTMNTADRSIALMDTALRRRFKFEEMLPNYDLLKDIFVEDEGIKVNIGTMLKAINERIEYLYDREHTIGHAVFLELKENNNIDKLENIFKKSVIPLLQEYFYEDYDKIRLILGDNAKDED